MASPTSASASRQVLPASKTSSAASSKSSPRMSSAARKRTAARSRAGVSRQRGKARRAAATAPLGLGLRRRSRPSPTTSPGRAGLTEVSVCVGLDRLAADRQRPVLAEPAAAAPSARARGPPSNASGSRPREVGVRLVDEGGRRRGVRRRARRGSRCGALPNVGRRAAAPARALTVRALGEGQAQERLVGRVLEQAPHEVGHAGDQLADRRVLAQAQAQLAHGGLDRLAHAVQHLQLEGAPGQAEGLGGGDGVGQRAHVVAGEGRADLVRCARA